MFHKVIIFTLFLSYLIALGNCQKLFACTPAEREQLTQNVCSNVSFAIGCLCLFEEPSSFRLEFQSFDKCEEVKKTLTDTLNIAPEVSDCVSGIQIHVNHTMLEKVCEIDGIAPVSYQKVRNLCDVVEPSSPLDGCHRLECITNEYNHICDNTTFVGEFFNFSKRGDDTFTESQQYIMRFNNTGRGERQCNRAADLLNSNRFLRRYESTLYTNNCGSPERILGCTLNLRGLEWACSRKQLMRVTFEEKYLNESICRNVTKAQNLFFPNDTKFENFTVTYRTRSRNACNSLVDCLTNSTDPNINATLSISNCEQTPSQIQGTLNYEALKLVCSKTDPTIATVVQLRNDVQTTTTEEPNTDDPGIGLIIG